MPTTNDVCDGGDSDGGVASLQIAPLDDDETDTPSEVGDIDMESFQLTRREFLEFVLLAPRTDAVHCPVSSSTSLTSGCMRSRQCIHRHV